MEHPSEARVTIEGSRSLGDLKGLLFGQFIELAGRCINNGLYDPQSSLARADGLRADVVEALRELKPSHIRYPGGCACAYFDWQELVGPKELRPRAKLVRVTNSAQPTAFGIPEAHALCQELGAELYLTVNAHTQSPEDAANLVEYLNSAQETRWADLRRSHGRDEPYGVKLFGLGNEIYGDWQPGRKTVEEYVRWCEEAILQMKLVDRDVKIVVCGLGRPNPEWDRRVIQGTLGDADMISVHNYFGSPIFEDSMTSQLVFQQMIDQLNENISEAMDLNLAVGKRPLIALDEWNVWYRSRHCPEADLEEIYDFVDALNVGALLHTVLRNATSIGLSNISLLANTLGSLFTDRERSVRQTIFYPQKMLRDAHSGRVVQADVRCPTFSGKHERFFSGVVDPEKARDSTRPTLVHFESVPVLDVLVSVDDASRKMAISMIHKSPSEPIKVRFVWCDLCPRKASVRVHQLKSSEFGARNTLDRPAVILPETTVETVRDQIVLPPSSFTVLEFEFEEL